MGKKEYSPEIDGGANDRREPPLLSRRGYPRAAATGLSNKEIAEKLYLSNGTVRNYMSGLL